MIVLGSDHGGYELKQEVIKHLQARGVDYEDIGCYDTVSCDYPQTAQKAARLIAEGKYEKGLLFCGTGIGMSIAANKVPGIRAACCSDSFSAKYTRMHNDANILCLGGRVVGAGLGIELVDLFLDTDFEGGRHQKRLELISKIEEENGR